MKTFPQVTPELGEYIYEVSLRDNDLKRRLREATSLMPNAGMQISADQGQFMALLVKLIGAKKAIEIGSFTGYSALCVAEALPEDGMLVACDVSEEWTQIGRRYWKEAGVADKIDLRLGPAHETLDTLLEDAAQQSSYDFAFIDADKSSYDSYYERCLSLLRPGGLVAVDNVLWGGRVADPEADDLDTNSIRALNEKIGKDEHVDASLVPVGDGLMLARKR